MARILISWMAFENDFLEDRMTPNLNGPNASIHKSFYDYDYHLMLSSASGVEEDKRFIRLINYIKTTFEHDIRPLYMNIEDVIGLKEILLKTNNLLLENRKHEIEVFISPGTPTMQVAWYLSHFELGLNTKLFQVRPAKFSKSGKAEKFYTDIDKSPYTSTIVINEDSDKEVDSNGTSILKTKSIEGIYEQAIKIASMDQVSAMIYGDTGTGKENLARYIHDKSISKRYPFIPVNCAAIPTELIESELFGHEKGSFTNAEKRVGKFEEAMNGTIFLDEIADLSIGAQAKLLRVLQEKKLTRIGSNKIIPIKVRVIGATNKNLEEMCESGLFRWDLYYRLNVVELNLPTLNVRGKKELKELLVFFMEKGSKKYNRPLTIESKALETILNYNFPGNIRELENLVTRFFALCDKIVTIKDLPEKIISIKNTSLLLLSEAEKIHIRKIYELCEKNAKITSKVLGISYTSLQSKLKLIYYEK